MEEISSPLASSSVPAPQEEKLVIRTMKLSSSLDATRSPVTVAMGRLNQTYVLVSFPDPLEPASLWTQLSMFIVTEPFPGYNTNGNEMIWVKNYSENAGYVEQLVTEGWISLTGRKAKQGFVEVPMCQLQLAEGEMIHYCNGCDNFESIEGQRYLRCASCQRRYYCSKECQSVHWKTIHRLDCKDLKALRYAEVENRENAHRIKGLTALGFNP